MSLQSLDRMKFCSSVCLWLHPPACSASPNTLTDVSEARAGEG